MAPIPGLLRWFYLVTRPFQGRAAVTEEVQFHLEMTRAELIARGWSAEAALAEAHRRFGDSHQYQEALVALDSDTTRRRARTGWFADWRTDVRQLLRGLGKAPAFTAGVTLTLTLGIGMNATMLGLVDRLLFKPPAGVVDPDRVVRYTLTQTSDGYGSYTSSGVTWNELDLLTRQAKRVSGVAGFSGGTASLGRGPGARAVSFQAVTPNFFGLLGVMPEVGRFFASSEDPIDGSAQVAVISYRMWEREFRRRADVIGQEIWLGSVRAAIIGVTPRHFNGVNLDAVDVWLPLHTGGTMLAGPSSGWRNTWNWSWVRIVARLAPGVTAAEAGAEATALYRAATAEDPGRKNRRGAVAFRSIIAARGANPGKEPMVAVLLAAVSALLLVITCANVANLLLARGLARRREIAVRLALGIGRGRLIRTLLGESLALAGLGAAGGIALAYGAGLLVRRWFFANIDFVEPPVDGRLLLLTVVVTLVTAGLIGLVPALRMSKPDLAAELKSGSSGQASGSRPTLRLRRGLLLMQGTLSVLTLIGAGLFVASFLKVASVDLGFRPEGVLVAGIDLREAGYSKDQQLAFYDEAYQRLRSLPGVGSISLASANPFESRSATEVAVPGRDSVPRAATGGPYFSAITPEYFTTMGIQLQRGRAFTPADRLGAPSVVIVNETLARGFWPGEDPVGKCFVVGATVKDCREIIGVVRDAESESLTLEPTQAFYVPLGQSAHLTRDRTLLVKAAGDPVALAPSLRTTIQGLAADLPVADVQSLTTQMDDLYRPWRLGAAMFAVMGLVALAIVLVGLYSVLGYEVTERRKEFGIRSALGADAGTIVGLVVGQGLRTVGAALALGLVVALLAGSWVGNFLFQTSPRDPLVRGGAAAVMIAAAAIGAILPARRAARADPAETLRAD